MKIAASLLALALATAPASAFDDGTGTTGAPKGSGGGGSVTYAFGSQPAWQNSLGSTSVSFTASIGTSASNRVVNVCVGASYGVVSALTVAGVSATQDSTAMTGGAEGASLWHAAIGTTGGTGTATIAVTMNVTGESLDVSTATINTATPAAGTHAEAAAGRFSNDPQTTSSALTVVTNGVGVACGMSTAAGTAVANSPFTLDSTLASGSNRLTMIHTTTTGSQTPSFNGFPFADFSIASGAYGP